MMGSSIPPNTVQQTKGEFNASEEYKRPIEFDFGGLSFSTMEKGVAEEKIEAVHNEDIESLHESHTNLSEGSNKKDEKMKVTP